MQPIYRQSQYRNTAVHQPGRAPQVNIPMPDYSGPAKAAAAMVDHADALQNQLVDEIEYSTSLAEEERISSITNNAINEYSRRSNLPDGHPDSWYDDRGIFREDEYKNWEHSQLSQLVPSTEGFIRPESKRKASEIALQTRQNLRQQLTARQASDIPRHARRRLQTSFERFMEEGNIPAATRIITEAPSWVISDQDKLALLNTAHNQGALLQLTTTASSGDPESFLNLYSAYIQDPNITPATRLKMQQLIGSVTPVSQQATAGRDKNGTVIYKEDFPRLPFGVPDYIYDNYTHHGGQPVFKADPELRMQSHKLLTRFAAESVNVDSPESVARFMIVAELHGFEKTEANAILEPLRKMYKEANEYNPKETSQSLVNWRYYGTESQRSTVQALDLSILRLSSQLSDLPKDASDEDRESINQALNSAQSQLAAIRESIEKTEREAESNTLAAYLVWRDSNPQATKGECITKYYDLLDTYTHSQYSDLLPYQHEIQAFTESAKRLEAMRVNYGAQMSSEELAANIAETDSRRSAELQAAPVTMECSNAFNANLPETNSQPIIYLPSDSAETRTTIRVRNGKTSIPAKVVKTDKIATASLSNMLQLQLGVLGSSGYNSVLFSGGEASLTYTPQSDTFGQNIIALEARRDKDGNITAYKLPAADGGGEYEIAGINQKYHKEAYTRIKALIDAGKHQEAEKAISNYICHYTQPAGDYLATQGVKSSAAEYMLRDIYFNMGPGGMNKVIARAFPGQSIADYYRLHGEQALIQRIYTARAGYYEAIIRSNPKKKIFRNGWLNRNNKVLATAISLVK